MPARVSRCVLVYETATGSKRQRWIRTPPKAAGPTHLTLPKHPALTLTCYCCHVHPNIANITRRAVLAVTSEYHPKLLDLGITRIDGSDKHFLKYRCACVLATLCYCCCCC
jgi:hypothetical protein